MIYEAKAHREGQLWVIEVGGVGVTQSRSLRDAHAMACDLVAIVTDQHARDIHLNLQVRLPEDLEWRLDEARLLATEARKAQAAAADSMREVVRHLRGVCGFSGRDVAQLLGVSEQRVSQLAAARG